MSSAVSLPNHTFTGQALSSKRLTSIVHILSPEKDSDQTPHSVASDLGPALFAKYLGPVVQSIVSLTTSLRVISLTVLADSIHNILIFFAEKM